MRRFKIIIFLFFLALSYSIPALAVEPVVAIHVSEATQALESITADSPTPTGSGTTGKEWWTPWWPYHVMPESLKEALLSDGTPFVVVNDAQIAAGFLLDGDKPRFPIVISLSAEAVDDDEIDPLREYVSAGGFLLVGSSAFTRYPDGTSRGDFALTAEMGLRSASSALNNWQVSSTFTKQSEHRLVSHIPSGTLTWRMPLTSEDINWGISPTHIRQSTHHTWQTIAGDATVIAYSDQGPYLTVKRYGDGYFIYHAAMQPLIGHGGGHPGMYAYGIFRNAIEWAFGTSFLPIVKVSPWPYPYNAAYLSRHDFENYQDKISAIEASAENEKSVGAKGDYYFCTGTVREEMGNDPAVVAGLRNAVSLYGATIGSHNGGLKNPGNTSLTISQYDYWHWGLDEALDFQPSGYSNGKAYALESMSRSLDDIDTWLAGLDTNKRTWVAPYFNSTREDSYEILDALNIVAAGEQKLSPFPHWTVSTRSPGKRFGFVSLPVSDWYIGADVAQSSEDRHTTDTIYALVDYYYDLGALINLYNHTVSTSLKPNAYIRYCAAKPAIWPTNAAGVYDWWTRRSVITLEDVHYYTTEDNRFHVAAQLTGAQDPDAAIEFFIPGWDLASSALQIKLDHQTADSSQYRTYRQGIKIKVGGITSVDISYPIAGGVPVVALSSLGISPASVPGGNSSTGTVTLNNSAPTGGQVVTLTSSNASVVVPASVTVAAGAKTAAFNINTGEVAATTQAVITASCNDTSRTATLEVYPAGNILFSDDFSGENGADPLWVTKLGSWNIADGAMTGSSPLKSYGYAYVAGNWTDYSLEGRIKLNAGAPGAGLGGRLNPATGAHYGIWVYPSNVLKVVKFRSWTTWSGTAMAQASLPAVGTSWHTLKATFQGNRIQVFYDGAQVIDVTDNGFDSRAPYTAGGVSLDMYTAATSWLMNVDDILVTDLTSESVPVVALSSLGISPASVPGGSASTGTVTLDNPAPTGGQVVELTSSNASVVVPASVTVAAGAKTAAFNINTGEVAATTQAVITASCNDTSRTATLEVYPAGNILFSDDFSGENGADPLWVTKLGSWNIADGAMTGSSPLKSYGYAYVAGNWTDYSLEGRIKLNAGAPGAGLGGRLNPATGAHYGIWVYPSNVLKVVKFRSWTTWSGTAMAQASLPAVGTSWHTLKATFQGNRIQVFYDGAQVIDVTDTGFDSRAPYTGGGINLGMYTSTVSWLMNADDILVTDLASGSVPVVALSSLGISPASVPGGSSSTGTVTLNNPAPTGGQVVTLTSSNAAAVVPTSVTVAAGAKTAAFNINTGEVAATTQAVITARCNDTSRTASLEVYPAGNILFRDDFSVESGADPLWVTKLGSWNAANGVMTGSSPLKSYGYAYVAGNWTDYSVEGRIKLNAGAPGAGLGGRLNPATGAHYGVWVYPSNVVKVVKFRSWTTWSGTAMAQASVPTVGTAWHTLKVNFQGNRIQVFYDGAQVIDVTDTGFDSRAPYTGGGINLGMYTSTVSWLMNADDIVVDSL